MATYLGVKVHLTYSFEPHHYNVTDLRNVTEIHMRKGDDWTSARIAFESDIHGSGFDLSIGNIIEFEAVPETEIAEAF